ncbi:MAG: hypothetical protein P9L94_05880 [Candidatus Hinthialibacter antarcticus]|nr:hypothetical protein [Candidatus Hinthialibacter antarcticus]
MGSKDILRVRLKENQYQSDAGLKKDYIIQEVIEHKAYNPPIQDNFLYEGE